MSTCIFECKDLLWWMISITWTLENILKFSLKDGVGVDNWLFIHAARNNGHGYQAKYGDGHVQNAHWDV